MAHIKVYITFRRGVRLLETNGANFAFSLFTLPVHYCAILVLFCFLFPPSPCIMRACSVRFMPCYLTLHHFPFAAGTTPSIPTFILLIFYCFMWKSSAWGGGGRINNKKKKSRSPLRVIVADAAMTFEKLAPIENRSQSEMVSTFLWVYCEVRGVTGSLVT